MILISAVLAFLFLVEISAAIHGVSLPVSIAHTIEIVGLSRAATGQRSQFENEAAIHSHMSSRLENLLDSKSPLHEKQHSFILTVDESFDVSTLRSIIGASRFTLFYQNHYQVSAKPSLIASLLAAFGPSLLGVVPLVPTLKINSHLYQLPTSCNEEPLQKKMLHVLVDALTEEELIAFSQWLQAASTEASFTWTPLPPADENKFIRVDMTCEQSLRVARLLADQPEVLWIEESQQMKTSNYWARGVMESGAYYNEPIQLTAGLTGAGQIIGVADTGLDMYSTYFYDNVTVTPNAATPNNAHRKVVSYTYQSGGFTSGDGYDDSEAHGSHVCGIAAGKAWENYGDFKRFNGIASDAKLAFFDIQKTGSAINLPSDINKDLFGVMYSMGARIFTNSWGDTAFQPYDSNAIMTDQFMVDHPDALVLFACGNSGDPIETPSVPNPVSSVDSPGTFKNGVTVGAGLNDQQSWQAYTFGSANGNFGPNALAKFSSRGPTGDGRMKPEVVAPGYWITAAKGVAAGQTYHTGVIGKAGTSMSTPAAAGMAAIIRQYFTSGYYYTTPGGSQNSSYAFNPSGALLKAMLISSAKAMSTIFSSYDGGSTYTITQLTGYPSNDQGYGRLQVNSVLNFGLSSSNPLSLFVIGDTNVTNKQMYKVFNASGQSHSYTFQVAAAKSVRVTMTYSDTTASAGGRNVIINDLALKVTTGAFVFNPYSTSKNTFKVIDVDCFPGLVYTVTVTATYVSPAYPQTYALVMVGAVNGLPATTANSQLLQSSLKLQDIPFIPAIIGMTIISFLILVAILTILISNRCPAKTGCCSKVRG